MAGKLPAGYDTNYIYVTQRRLGEHVFDDNYLGLRPYPVFSIQYPDCRARVVRGVDNGSLGPQPDPVSRSMDQLPALPNTDY